MTDELRKLRELVNAQYRTIRELEAQSAALRKAFIEYARQYGLYPRKEADEIVKQILGKR